MSKNLQKLLEIKRDFDRNNPMHVNLVDNILREFGHLDNVSGIETDNSSLLFFAAEKRCVKLVEYLVEDRKVNVDIDISHEGWTPLMIACSYYFEFDSSSPPGSGDDELEYLEEYYKIVDCLLRNSANPFKLTRSDPVHNALEIVCTNTDGPLNPLLALFVFRESQLKIYPEIFLKFIRDNAVPDSDVIEYLLVHNCLQPNQICLTKEGKPSNALVEAICTKDNVLVEKFLSNGADPMQCQVPGDISASPLSKALSLACEVDPDSPEFDSSIIKSLIHSGAVLSLEEAEFIRNELKIDLLGVPFAPIAAPMARAGEMEL